MADVGTQMVTGFFGSLPTIFVVVVLARNEF